MFIRFSTNFHGLSVLRMMLEHLISDFLEKCSSVCWAASVLVQKTVQNLPSLSLSVDLGLWWPDRWFRWAAVLCVSKGRQKSEIIFWIILGGKPWVKELIPLRTQIVDQNGLNDLNSHEILLFHIYLLEKLNSDDPIWEILWKLHCIYVYKKEKDNYIMWFHIHLKFLVAAYHNSKFRLVLFDLRLMLINKYFGELGERRKGRWKEMLDRSSKWLLVRGIFFF